MKIRLYGVGEKRRRLRLSLPNALLLNRATAFIAMKALQKQDEVEINLSYSQILALMDAVRSGKKCLNGLPLVQVQSADGEQVEIYL